MEVKRRITGIAELQFFCCCMIVLRHSDPINGLGIQPTGLTNRWEWLIYTFIKVITHMTEVAVPTFFLISGFLYFSNFDSLNDYITKIRRRIRSIVVPYFIWSFLNWLYFAVATHIPAISAKMNMEPVQLDAKSIVRDIAMSNYAPLWFLRELFCLCILGVFLNVVLNHNRVTLVVTLMLVIWNVLKGYGYHSIMAWLPFFIAGGYLKKYGNKISSPKILLVVAIILILCSYALSEGTEGGILYVARFLMGIALFTSFYSRKTTEKWFWGTSMFIYCTHFSVVSTIEKLMFLAFGKRITVGLLAYMTVPAVTIFALSHIAKFISAASPNVWKIIAGNRSLIVKNE